MLSEGMFLQCRHALPLINPAVCFHIQEEEQHQDKSCNDHIIEMDILETALKVRSKLTTIANLSIQ